MKWRGRSSVTAVVGLILLLVCWQAQEARSQGCAAAKNCSECLDSGVDCRWCADRVAQWQDKRCAGNDAALTGCSDITNPRGSKDTTMNDAFADTLQVRPQEFHLSMRPGQVEQLQVTLKPTANYPLDVYYLMDHSKSMHDDLVTLKDQSVNLAKAIEDVSTNYKIGYGSFVDKMAAPFALTFDGKAIKQEDILKIGYSFENTFPLEYQGGEKFQRRVKSEGISANVDSPEGGFDAMMQVAVCGEKIGWREKSRKVMIVATDHAYHAAGDGRLAGVVRLNDGRCHLDGRGFYTESLNQDYPSIGWLNDRLLNNSILSIFTVTENYVPHYEALSERINDARVVPLKKDSSNLVTIVKKELATLIKEGKITVFPEGGVNISIQAECPGGQGDMRIDPLTKFPICTALTSTSQATYTITVTARKCNELKNLDSVTIRFVGFGDVVIKITPLCSCACEDHPIKSKDWCGEHAEDQCAICVCDENFTGDFCDCTKEVKPCIQPGANVTCSNRGKCECGMCQCKPLFATQRVWGKYCECDNTSCPRDDNGLICGGPKQGICNCSCICLDDFFGPACNCTNDNSTCIFPGENRVCSGNGRCECGRCVCIPGYTGRYCQECIGVDVDGDGTEDEESSDPKCQDICLRSNHCLFCYGGNQDPTCSNCRGTTTIESPGATHFINVNGTLTSATRCETTDEDGCLIVYWAAEESQQRYFAPLEIESDTKRCPKPVNYLPLILGIVFGLLLLGLLLLLLWRAIISLKERNEYRGHVKNRGAERPMGENPLFKKPKTTYSNPLFSR